MRDQEEAPTGGKGQHRLDQPPADRPAGAPPHAPGGMPTAFYSRGILKAHVREVRGRPSSQRAARLREELRLRIGNAPGQPGAEPKPRGALLIGRV